MKQVAIVSGKGGTGKTSITAAFAVLASGVVLADCDVDAANLELVISAISARRQPEPFRSGFEMVLDQLLCDGCGRCTEVCRFEAVALSSNPNSPASLIARIDPINCQGCAACAQVCPNEAISMREKVAGELLVSNTRFGPLVHARLEAGEDSSGKLVTMVRSRARELALADQRELVLVDGPPGIGCPVIASLAGVDQVVAVAEPTISGLHDLERVLSLCAHFALPVGVVVNKADLNDEMAAAIRESCMNRGIPLFGEVPHDPIFVAAAHARRTVPEMGEESVSQVIRETWAALLKVL